MADDTSRRSWLSQVSASTNRLLSPSSHELPQWRTPSPMTGSIIPPPIVQSTYAISRSSPPERMVFIAKPAVSEERQHELEADLQFLLDAQAEGLLKGLSGGLPDDQTSTGSTTPTARSYRSVSSKRTRLVRPKPGLRSARKGIYNSILALADLKAEDIQAAEGNIKESDRAVKQIDEWEEKRKGLHNASKAIDDGEETVRMQRLQQEANKIQEQINQVEKTLAELKARQRKIVRQSAALENSMKAKLATYTSSLSMLEQDVQKFLSLGPEPRTGQASPTGKEASMWQLPPDRRTLEMAREYWRGKGEAMQAQRQEAEKSKNVLDEGAKMWKRVVLLVTDFEKKLRKEMSNMSTMSATNSMHAWEDPHENESTFRSRELLQNLDPLIEALQADLEVAESRNWKLLIVSIGAELEALKQGKKLLGDASEVDRAEDQDLLDHYDEQQTDRPHPDLGHESAGEQAGELEQEFTGSKQKLRPVSTAASSSDVDEDPDPELLFSRQDTDTE